ncbi:MAG: phosphoadenosine phosphosulfate reductase family protein [Crenarchaeota archaeon]|nr:phosphoadenosine phosphosulfate reductase family protein [Thermoproteota archaeon]
MAGLYPGKNMYQIIVKSRSDAGAIESMVDRFYHGWPIVINTLKGGKLEALDNILDQLLKDDHYNFVFLGRKDLRVYEHIEKYDEYNNVVYLIDRSRVRNIRIEHLAWFFEKARSLQRLRITSKKGRLLLGRMEKQIIPEPEPYMDLFILHVSANVSEKIGLGPGTYLVLRGLGGKHFVIDYSGIKGILTIPDNLGIPKYSGDKLSQINPSELIKYNTEFLEQEERIVVSFMNKFKESFDRIIVPVSGGKDSATALYLAKKVYGERVEGVFVDIDLDMPHNKIFINRLEQELKVPIHRVRVELHKYLSQKGFPTPNNRWCTALKIAALENMYGELCRDTECLIVVGDRDVESEARGRRSPVIVNDKYVRISPLKQWSTLTLQLYMMYRKIPVNPLYDEGFYRLGCFICPSLRGWEHLLINTSPMLRSVRNDMIYKNYVEYLKNTPKEYSTGL